MDIWYYLALYFTVGFVALLIFDLITGRIRRKLKPASVEAQDKLVKSGNVVGTKTAIIITILALWVFWPFAIYAAIRG